MGVQFFNGHKETTTWMLQKQQHMHAVSDEYPGYRASMGPRRASIPGMEYMPQREDTFREYRRPEMRDDTFTRYLQHPEMRQMNGRDPSYGQYDASQVKYQQHQGGGGYRDDHNNFGSNYTSSASSRPPKAQSKGGVPKYADNDVSEDDDDEFSRGGSNGAKKSGSGKAGGRNQHTGGGGARQGGWMHNEYDDDRGHVQGTSKKPLGKSMSNGNLQDMQYNGMNGGGQGMWPGGESTEGYGRSMSVPKMPPTSKSSNKSQGQLYNGGQGGQGMWMQNDFDDDDNRVNSSGKKSGAKGNKSSQQNGSNGQHGDGGWMSNGDFDEDDDNRMNGSRGSANKVSKGTGNGHNVTSASNGRGDDAWAYAQNSQGQGYNGNMQKPKSAMKQGNAQQRSNSKYDTSDDEEDNDSAIKKGVKWALGLSSSSSNNSRNHNHNGGGHDQYNQKGSNVSSYNRFDNQGYANQGYDEMSRSGSKKSGGSSQGKSGQHYNGHMDDLSPMIMAGAKKSGLKKSKSVDFDEMGYSSAEENRGNFNASSKGAQYNQSSTAKGGHQQQHVQGPSGKAQNKVRQLESQILPPS